MGQRKVYDRRVLYTAQSEMVREMWKEVVSSKVTLSGIDIDIHDMVETEGNPRYMCRSCFDKYKTLAKLQNELSNKAENALAKITTSHFTSARKRSSTTLQQPPPKRLFVEDEPTSPAVVVSH